MKISNVYSSNIDMAIRGLVLAQNSNDQIRIYLKKSNMFFSNCEISLELTNVKGYELLLLSDFCSSIIVLNKRIDNIGTRCLTSECLNGSGTRYTDIRNQTETIARKNYQTFVSLAKTYNDKTDTPYELDGILPIGSLTYHIIARFEGVSLYNILSAIPSDKLVKDRKNGIFYDVNEKDFENMIGRNFISNFYQFIETESSMVDVLSDVMMNDYYLNYAKNNGQVVLAHINTPYGKLPFTGVDDTNAFKQSLDKLKSGFQSLPNKDFSKFANNYMVVRSSLKTYLLFKIFTNLVTYKPDLNVTMSVPTNAESPDFIKEESYALSYLQAINSINELRLNALKVYKAESVERNREKERSLSDRNFALYLRNNGSKIGNTYIIGELYEYMPLSSEVTYVISASPDHFEYTLDKIRQNDQFEKSNEVNSILLQIEQINKAVENTFITN